MAPLNFFLSFTVLQFWLGATFTSSYFHFYIVHHIFVLMNQPECFIELCFFCVQKYLTIFSMYLYYLRTYNYKYIPTERERSHNGPDWSSGLRSKFSCTGGQIWLQLQSAGELLHLPTSTNTNTNTIAYTKHNTKTLECTNMCRYPMKYGQRLLHKWQVLTVPGEDNFRISAKFQKYSKLIYPLLSFAKYTRPACLLSFASLLLLFYASHNRCITAVIRWHLEGVAAMSPPQTK